MKKIIVTEKPSVASTYARILGLSNCRYDGYYENSEWIITWCVGHLVTMSYPEKYDEELKNWKMEDLPFIPEKYLYEVIPDVAEQFAVIKRLYNRTDIGMIYYAGDSAREGIYIQMLVRMMAGHNPSAIEKVVWIDSQTDSEIKRGIKEARDIPSFKNMIDSAYMRAIEDYSVGINFSRALTLRFQDVFHLKGSVPVGRVMTCVLGMIVEKERAILNFVPTNYYKIHSRIEVDGEVIEAEWRTDEPLSNMYKNNGFLTKEDAAAFRDKLPRRISIDNINITQEKKKAPLLFNLAELQSTCSRVLHISPAETLKIAQTLYEAKMTTYPRTDARVLSTAIAEEIEYNVRGLGGLNPQIKELTDKILQNDPTSIVTSKYVDDSKISDHYAIIPTGEFTHLFSGLKPQEKEVYKLIVSRFLSIFMPPAVYKKITITEDAGGQKFYAAGSALIDPGYMVLLGVSTGSSSLPVSAEKIKNGDVYDSKYGIIGAKTSPPSRYTTGSIVLAMENAGNLIEDEDLRAQIKGSGIGTSATRAEILIKLEKNGFIKSNPKTQIIQPETKGYINYEIVKNLVPEMLNPKMTARWEQNLMNIQEGNMSASDYHNQLNNYVREKVDEIKNVPVTKELSDFINEQKANIKASKSGAKAKGVQTYLNVPYEDKDEVKRLGAYFDMEKKAWYVPEGKDVTLFSKWDAHTKAVRKVYLKVPFEDKDTVKKLGAKWDMDKKKWYITTLFDKNTFAKWIEK